MSQSTPPIDAADSLQLENVSTTLNGGYFRCVRLTHAVKITAYDGSDMATGLLTTTATEQIVATCRTVIGDSLRSITYFTRDDFEQVYLRNDLERDADLSTFIGHEWRGFKTTQTVYEGSELGAYDYTIRVFENGFLVRVTNDSEGVFVTTDGLTVKDFEEVATALDSFLSGREVT